MHNIDLILTITAGLTIALILGYITQRIGLSPIVGYLLAGIAVGPFTPGYVANHAFAEQLAEIGVVLLMFGVGLTFHIKELLAVRRVAIPGAVAQSLVATLLGMVVGVIFGWNMSAGVVFGLSIAVASTVVLIRVLSDNNDLHTPTGHIAVGWLVVEDLFTVFILVILPTLFGSEHSGIGDLAIGVGITLLKVAGLVAVVFVVGGKVVPWMLERIVITKSKELFNLSVLAVALGIAVGSSLVFGVSMALGAFLAGIIVGRSDFSLRAATEVLPMRDAFAVLFFVSIGMLFNPTQLLENPLLVLATLGVILIGKSVAAVAIVVLLRFPLRVALSVAVALAQIGEFSFILASLGRELGLLTPLATNAIITAAIVAITLNPILYRLVSPMESWAMRQPRLWNWLSSRTQSLLPGSDDTPHEAHTFGNQHQAVIIGYGPVGRTVSRLLRENRITPIIVEMNLETVRSLRESGERAEYGDASHSETLRTAGVGNAQSLIITVGGLTNIADVVKAAREINPGIWILARATYAQEVRAMRDAGIHDVFSAEGEVALAMTTTIMQRLGATSEQIERERERIHSELGEPLVV